MFRVFAVLSLHFVLLTAIVSPVQAAPFAMLEQPSQTATIRQDGIQMMAFYEDRGHVLNLTIVITDPEGEALRTRIGLRDRQHHTLLLEAEADFKPATRIEFMRTGKRIEMIFSDTEAPIGLSADQTRQRFQ